MKTHSLVQGSQEWIAHRAQFWNASDAPAMMGCSPHMTRTELLHMKKTGITAEVDAATQRRFDDGHRFEALARPLAEKIVGEDLYPVTGTNGELSASFDGLTLMEDVAFEHKTLNAELRECLEGQDEAPRLPLHYRVQMEQQLIVSGAGRVLFMASEWKGDELVEERHCWYASDKALRAQIIAGWQQFAIDLVSFTPEAPAAPAPTGKAPEALPALHIVLKGEVSASNLATFKDVALAAIRSVNRDLQTDQDFADSAKARKWCEDIESKVAAAKEHALGQTASIDELFRAMDEISAEARRVRLELDKLEKARNLAINGEIVADGVKQFADHMKALNAAMPAAYMPAIQADFGGAIKGLRSVASKKDAVATELARVKIIANEHATRITANLRTLAERKDMAFLFADVGALVLKAPDDLAAVMAQRVSRHEAEQAAKEEAQRERIRDEEAAKLQREADEKRRAEEAEAQRKARAEQEEADRLEREEYRRRGEEAQAQREAQAAIAVAATPAPAAALPIKEEATEVPDLAIGKIGARLGFSVSTDFLQSLGFTATHIHNARLFRESDFPKICAAIARHVEAVANGVPA